MTLIKRMKNYKTPPWLKQAGVEFRLNTARSTSQHFSNCYLLFHYFKSVFFFILFYFPTRASVGFSVIPIDAIDELDQELIRT